MAKKIIRTGTTADPIGDSLKNAFVKVNDNFTELYNALGLDEGGLNLGAFEFTGSVISTTDSSAIVIDQATTITSNLSVGGDILPQTANGGDLGSSTLPWRSLYVSNSTIYLGGVPLGIDANGNLTVNGSRTNAPGSTLVNGAYTVSLGSDGLLNVAGPVTLQNYGELRPSSAAYDAALAGWEFIRGGEIASRIANGQALVQYYPMVDWHPTGATAQSYLDFLLNAWTIQNTGGATLIIQPPMSSAFYAQLRTSLNLIKNTYSSIGSGVSIAAGYNKSWHFNNEGDLTIPGDIRSNSNINIEINLSDSTLRRWQFGEDGSLTFPDGTSQSTAGGAGGGSTLVNGAYIASLGSDGSLTLPGDIKSDGNINIDINLSDSTLRRWQFGEDGNLTLGGIVFNGSTTTNISGSNIDGTYQVFYSAGEHWFQGPINRGNFVWVDVLADLDGVGTAGHIRSGQGQNLIIDGGYENPSGAGGNLYLRGRQIEIRANVSGAGIQSKNWIFTDDGALTIPGDIRSEGNINIDINLADSTLHRWRFGEDGDLTIPGKIIHPSGTSGVLFSENTFRINTWLTNGSDTTYIEGQQDALFLMGYRSTLIGAGSNSWDFGENGHLTIPGNIVSDKDITLEVNLYDSTKRIWQFGEDGNLTFPDGTNQSTAATTYTLPIATTSVLGGVKVDGTSVTISDGVISVNAGLAGSVTFKGGWDANTNTPTLANGAGTAGWMYIVTVGGTQDLGAGSATYAASDLLVYDGTSWIQVAANTGVVTFNTRRGAVTLTDSDVTTALGFTPYNATNPSAYLTSITSGNVTSALGYTPIQASSLSVSTASAAGAGSLSYSNGVFTFTPAAAYTLPTATASVLGGVKIDNSTITISSGVISVSSALTSAVQFKGGWNASTNTPALSASLPAGVAAGWQYIVSDAGTRDIGSGSISYAVNDLVIYNGTNWIRIPGSSSVISFNTRQGAITLESGDVTTALGSTTANYILAAPNGSSGTASFRAAVLADISNLAAGVATFLATPTSSNLLSAITDETGTGKLLFSTSPQVTTSITTDSASFDLLNTTATTVNFAGAATTLSLGAATGTVSVNNATVTLTNAATVNVNGANPTLASTSTGTLTLFNTNLLTVNAFNAATTATLANSATTLGIGNTATAAQTVNMFTASTGASTYNFATGTTANATIKSISIGTGGASGSTTNIALGSSVSGAGGTTTINTALTVTPATAGTVTIGKTDGTGTITLGSSTAAQTVNIATGVTASGSAKTVNIGTNSASGSTTGITIGSTAGTTTLTFQGAMADATSTSTAKSVGYLGLPQSGSSTSATLAIGDAGKHIYVNTASQTMTIPANGTVAYPVGTTITFIAGPSATTVSIAITTDTMYLAGTGTTGTRTLAAHGMATAVKVASTTWYINGTGLT